MTPTAPLDLDDPHRLGVALIPPGARVLDLGCGDGTVAARLRELGCAVVGIERDKELAEQAAEHCREVIVDDVEHLDLAAALCGRRFDVVLCLNVLEHLVDPVAALRRAAEVLVPHGRLVVSVPNVTHGAVRLALLHGQVRHTEHGLLEGEPLHHFDRAALHEVLADSGFEPVVDIGIEQRLTAADLPLACAAGAELLAGLERDPDASIRQFVLTAGHAGRDHRPLALEAALDELVARRGEQQRLSDHVGDLEATIAADRAARADLEQRLQVTTDDLAVATAQATDAAARLATAEAERARLAEQVATIQAWPAYRLLERTYARGRRHPWVFGALRRVGRRLAR
jgi:SAM-dependent methyltransferase